MLALLVLRPVSATPQPRIPTASAAARGPAGVPGGPPRTATTPAAAKGPVLAIGASVMETAAPDLERRIPDITVDASVGRQFDAVIERLDEYRARGALPPVVVVQIGENGPITDADVATLRHALRGVRRVVLLNIRYPGESWIDDTNRVLERAPRTWPEASIADWRAASDNPDLLDDGTHPNPAGSKVYANVVARAIGR